MRKSIVLKIVGLTTVGVMLLGGTALAGAWKASTSVSISKKALSNHRVTFSGSLHSKRKACVANKRVLLVKGDDVVAAKHTSSKGAYSFTRTVHKGSKWYVAFPGSATGIHPSTHVCSASQSKAIRI